MKKYFADYRHKGQKWSVEFYADNWEDAEARLGRIALSTVTGEVFVEIPILPWWPVRLWRALASLSSEADKSPSKE